MGGPRRPPPIGLPADQLGRAPGTGVRFGGRTAMGYSQMAIARGQQPPQHSLTAAGMPGEAGACGCEAGVSPPGWRGTVEAMKRHPGITNPWALAWWMRGRGASPHYPERAPMREAAQTGGEFAYVTDVPSTSADQPLISRSAPQPYGYVGVPPEAVPYLQRGQQPPSPCSTLLVFDSSQARVRYQTWWQTFYGDWGPCPSGPAAHPPTVGETHEVTPSEYLGPPIAASGGPDVTTTTVTGPPESNLEPRKPPWGWIIGGTAAAGAIAAGVAYALHRKKRRRRRG